MSTRIQIDFSNVWSNVVVYGAIFIVLGLLSDYGVYVWLTLASTISFLVGFHFGYEFDRDRGFRRRGSRNFSVSAVQAFPFLASGIIGFCSYITLYDSWIAFKTITSIHVVFKWISLYLLLPVGLGFIGGFLMGYLRSGAVQWKKWENRYVDASPFPAIIGYVLGLIWGAYLFKLA